MSNQEDKKTILLVDDHNEIRENYKEIFISYGFEVITAENGIEALEKIENNKVDAVFTGIIMPRMDGFQLLESLKKHTHTSGIPVAINSHLGREQDKKKMMEMGADDFIVYGTVPPVRVAERIKRMVEPNKFLLKIIKEEADFKKFIEEKDLSSQMTCPDCGGDLALELKEKEKDVYEAKVVCLECKSYF
ncbi:MAG: response regulator [Patescibacteria group bacterium]